MARLPAGKSETFVAAIESTVPASYLATARVTAIRLFFRMALDRTLHTPWP